MNLLKLLTTAGVPEHLHAQAIACLREADKASDGLTWAKWKVRLFKAGKISKMLSWDSERLLEVRPDLADWDIAPMINITCNGDHTNWVMTPEGGRPVAGKRFNPDPDSDDYKAAVANNRYYKGLHPCTTKFRKFWYRRNAGEYLAWKLGKVMPNPILPSSVSTYKSGLVTIRECNGAWQIKAPTKILGFIPAVMRIGYEIDNLWTGTEQAWYPIAGYELRAPLTWSILPGKIE